MRPYKKVLWFLIIVGAVTIGIDIWLDATDNATISQFLLRISREHSWAWYLIFAFGGIFGHIFVFQREKNKTARIISILSLGSVIGADILFGLSDYIMKAMIALPLLWLLIFSIGALFGSFVFPQIRKERI